MYNPALLILGYNRPDLLKRRIYEISKMEVKNVYISIDGGTDSHKSEMMDLISKIPSLLKNDVQVKITHHKNNLGLTRHLTSSISKVLVENENIIVVEDDIILNSNFYRNIINGLDLLRSMKVNGLVYGFSPINYSGRYLVNNKWHQTKYFSCWGWGCSRQTWERYNSDLSNIKIDKVLSNSNSWSSLSNHQKNIWRARFNRVQSDEAYTWDIQMQFTSFLNDFTNLGPLFAFTSNEGFNDKRATHTKESKPRWVGSNLKNNQVVNHAEGVIASILMRLIDQITIAGDSILLLIYKKIKTRNRN